MTENTKMILSGDEAIALAAVHAGVSAAYAYPGTPSTEIVEALIKNMEAHGKPHAAWCANEKTAYESALGVSMAGKRVLVAMKHVGLNVAADPFMNSAIVDINGGLVLVVADDPSMHSSQDEQDSRYFADFAKIIYLEPTHPQEAYDMTFEALDLSERHNIPVMIRLVTRLAHGRAVVNTGKKRVENKLNKFNDSKTWTLLPSNARNQWHKLLAQQTEFLAYTESSKYNVLDLQNKKGGLGVITTGIAKNYFYENKNDLKEPLTHFHISAYPIPKQKVLKFAENLDEILIIEEGYPFVERFLRGLLPVRNSRASGKPVQILGKETGHLPLEGELNADLVRHALGIAPNKEINVIDIETIDPLPSRPPQLCKGCPHIDTYDALKAALGGFKTPLVTSDIGCYTLGALPPYNAIESCVCMGASIGMAKGAAEAGMFPTVAVIGDSTFLHSGITGLLDAVSANTNMTLLILDNDTTGMTGGQSTPIARAADYDPKSSRLEKLVLGLGVDSEHLRVIYALKKNHEENAAIIKKEIEHKGVSVVIAVRECLETVKRKNKAKPR